MTIAEFIEHLKKLDQTALVVRSRYEGNGHYRYEGFEGWWPQLRSLHDTGADQYREAHEDENGIDGLIL